eukprot:jgi/Mesvir1/2103/Mv16634-RA.1
MAVLSPRVQLFLHQILGSKLLHYLVVFIAFAVKSANATDVAASDDTGVTAASDVAADASAVAASDAVSKTAKIVDVAIVSIFLREVMEGVLLWNSSRLPIARSDLEEDEKNLLKKAMDRAAIGAFLVALVFGIAIDCGAFFAGQGLGHEGIEIAEGISKLIACGFVAQISLKLPFLLGIYPKPIKKEKKVVPYEEMGPIAKVRHSIWAWVLKYMKHPDAVLLAWNIFRETMELAFFVAPAIAAGNLKSVPVSAAIGIAIAACLGLFYYFAGNRVNKKFVCFLASGVLLFLAAGLFSGGWHSFLEEGIGIREKQAYDLGEKLSPKKFPGVLISPFGYDNTPTVFITTMWCFGFVCLCAAHYYLYWRAKKQRAMDAASGTESSSESPEKPDKGVKESTSLDSTSVSMHAITMGQPAVDPIYQGVAVLEGNPQAGHGGIGAEQQA